MKLNLHTENCPAILLVEVSSLAQLRGILDLNWIIIRIKPENFDTI